MTEVALASGFGSVRRFNETFQALFRRPPTALRGRRAVEEKVGAHVTAGVTLMVRYRPPYDWEAMLGYLEARAVEGVETIVGETYSRTIAHAGQSGLVEVSHEPARRSLKVTIRFPDIRALPSILAKVRRVFDVGADVETIGNHLSRDPLLAPLVASRPGLRAPGGWEGFELAVRAILGQQISTQGARLLGSKLVAICGGRASGPGELTLLFPTPQQLVDADLDELGMPSARRNALKALAEACLLDPLLFSTFGTIEESIERLKSIRGVGEWTAQYIALRALREPDAFPAGDVALQKSAAAGADRRPTAQELLERAETWRPWRAYAAQHLWAEAASGSHDRGTA
jgi:AraC family transcriptional regulator of adaptative response / DNA-3-methyladenine glycosylase II